MGLLRGVGRKPPAAHVALDRELEVPVEQRLPNRPIHLCDNALVCAMAQDRKPVDQLMVLEVAKDLNFAAPHLPPAPPQASESYLAVPNRFSLFRRAW